MANPLFRVFRRLPLLSLRNPLSSSLTSSRSIVGNPERVLHLLKNRLIPQNPFWESRNFSDGRVNFVLVSDEKLKCEKAHEVEVAPKKKKWKSKKKLKLQRKREEEKRKAANKKDPKRETFDTVEDRITQKIKKAKFKKAMLIKRLKQYEVSKVQGPELKPHFLTDEELSYIKKMAEKKSNHVEIGKRGVFGGVILNMHQHWKRHETVKVLCKSCKPGQIQEYADEIARLSGGIPIQIIANDTIVFYRGREYGQPENMSPVDTLSKKRDEQSLKSVRHLIVVAKKELKRHYRQFSVYSNDSRNRSGKRNGADESSSDYWNYEEEDLRELITEITYPGFFSD